RRSREHVDVVNYYILNAASRRLSLGPGGLLTAAGQKPATASPRLLIFRGLNMESRLAEFAIDGLFGLYSHRITLHLKERITIIIGPNGRGKTVCLKFIEALFRRKHDFFLDISFKTAQFTFTGGQTIRLERLDEGGKQAAEGAPARSICYTLHIPGKDSHSWTPAGIDSRLRREFRRLVPAQWEQVSPDLWIDQSD